ncbi:MAG: endonuclease [Saprospiraceae bacterium]|nr:endonuclease [Saprospiraceae bacterium]
MNKLYRILWIIGCIAAAHSPVFSQLHEPVFPNQQGAALLQSLVQEFKPATVLNYDDARDAMYLQIWKDNDSIHCVYTDHTLYLPPNEDNPVFHLLQFGSLNGIICEHTYPRSKGAESGNALSDMHHLVPARLGANLARNNFPFTEIADQQTSLWLYRTQSSSSMPTSNIDLYSEQRLGQFEPREDYKGNVARAMFYFYTMYRAEADAADAEFFWQQRPTLCQWHLLDPVDEKEWERTHLIANYQEGKRNPFVLDCSLAARAYCSDVTAPCIPTGVSNANPGDYDFRIFPNPPQARLQCHLPYKTAGKSLLCFMMPKAG